MARSGRKRSRMADQRKARAIASRQHLESILENSTSNTTELNDAAARDLIRLSRRHRLGLPEGRRSWICRDCQSALRPGVSCRVRVRGKVRIITCLKCGRINRSGPGHPTEEESE